MRRSCQYLPVMEDSSCQTLTKYQNTAPYSQKCQKLKNQREVTHIIISPILSKAELLPRPFRDICKIMKLITTDSMYEYSSYLCDFACPPPQLYSMVWLFVCLCLTPYHYCIVSDYGGAIYVTLPDPTTKEIQCLSTVWLFVFVCLTPPPPNHW